MAGINIFPDGIPKQEPKGTNIFPDGIPAESVSTTPLEPDRADLEFDASFPMSETPVDRALKAGMREISAGVKATPRTAAAIATGIPLWAIGKLRGTGELMRGHSVERAREVEQEIASKGVEPRTAAEKSAVGIVGDVMDVITWPARKAGETLEEMGYPRAGYLTELGGELATFKGIGKLKTKVLGEPPKGMDIVKAEKQSKLTPMEKAYEVQKDIWIGKKDRRIFEADIESRLLKKEIKDGLKPTKEPEYVANPAIKIGGRVIEGDYAKGGHIEIVNKIDRNPRLKRLFDDGKYSEGGVTFKGRFVEKKSDVDFADIKGRDINSIKDMLVESKLKGEKLAELYDEAIQVYIDLKSHPDHLDKYYDMLTQRQKEVVDLSQSLPPEIKTIAEKVAKSYETIGQEALDATVIRNMLENYAGRQWDLGPGKSLEAGRKFGTTTRHAKARKLGTILEGWAEGYDLKIKSGTENLRIYKHEIIRTLADKKLVDELSKIKDLEGNPLLSTQQLEGYVPVEHPNMTKWEWAGKIEEGKVYGKNFFATEDGQLFEKRRLYAPKREAKNINNILGVSKLADVRGIKGITKFNEVTKAWILQSSLFHHMAFMRSYYLPMGFKGKGQTPRQAYRSGIEAIEKSDPVLLHGVENGLTIGLKQDWSEPLLRESTFLGRQLDKVKATKVTKDWINKFREGQADFLFGEFGAGLKAKAYLLEYRHQMKKYPNANPDVVAKRVANLINDDFGGLNLARMGRNPTTQHIFRLFALAPDWTESNVRTMVKAMKNMTGDQAELYMYRKFWGGVVLKGLGVTALANYALAGGDVDEMVAKYKKAWRSGNFNWAKVDVTPIYELFGGQSGQSKYFSVFGHFQDVAKFIVHPLRSAKHKQSVVSGIALEALTGTDYTGVRGFTTFEELLGGEGTVKWGGKGKVDYEQFPSFVLSQLMGTQPIQAQAFMAWVAGEQEGFDALSQSIGLRTTTTYEKKKRMKKGLRKLKGLK